MEKARSRAKETIWGDVSAVQRGGNRGVREDRAVVLESKDSCDIARVMSPGLDKRGAHVKMEEKVANSFVVL